MSYDVKRKEFARERIDIIEIELEKCSRTYGTSPCTAQVGVTGSEKCHNTFATCQDKANYSGTATQVHRFCTNRSPLPYGIDAIPCLRSIDTSPTQIDIKGGLGVRASVSVSLDDFPGSDIGIDPYLSERTYDPIERGTFFTKLRARNPNYQYRKMKHIVTYLDGNQYNSANNQERHYVIDSFSASGGAAKIVGKDPLIKAMTSKSLVPAPSSGKLSSQITSSSTSLTLVPSGVGAEYPSSGKVVIDKEIISYTSKSGDTLNGLTRGENNTVAKSHNENATVQVCYEQLGKRVDEIVKDILVNYAGIDSSYIDDSAWQSEATSFIPTLLQGIIPKPTDVNKIIMELAKSSPHYLYWDERTSKIGFTALKPPSTGNALLTEESNIIDISVTDKTSMRKSTIFVHFGQVDPTKKLEEPENYEGGYARIDTNSIAEYGSSEVEVIYSRWIPITSEASARRLAALIGRRLRDIPREVNFTLDAKDASVWSGNIIDIRHRDILDPTSALPKDTAFQVLSVKEMSSKLKYKALEFTYGDELPEDEGGGTSVIIKYIPDGAIDYNMRAEYEEEYGTPTSSTVVKFLLTSSRIAGASSISTYAIDTGVWPTGAKVILEIQSESIVAGKGGDGAGLQNSFSAEDGGDCIYMRYPIQLINSGIIGGGGGGGAGSAPVSGVQAGGGGGAGNVVGEGGVNDTFGSVTVINSTEPEDGTSTSGGLGGLVSYEQSSGEIGDPLRGGKGGDLGQDGGGTGGGLAGVAIITNGNALTDINNQAYPSGNFGDIRGAIV